MPILSTLSANYAKLESVRRVVHQESGTSVFQVGNWRKLGTLFVIGLFTRQQKLLFFCFSYLVNRPINKISTMKNEP